MPKSVRYVIVLITLSQWIHCTAALRNTSIVDNNDSMLGKSCGEMENPLVNLGDISTKIVQTMASSEDETVDIIAIATLINALSKGTAIIKYPEMYKDMNMDDTELKVGKMDQTLRALSDQVKQLQTQNFLSMEMLEEELNQTKNDIKELQAQLQETKKLAPKKSQFTGFLARASEAMDLYDGVILIFSDIVYDYGSNFDATSGKFTCKQAGMYLVSVHLEEYDEYGLLVDVMVDDEPVFRIHVHEDNEEHGTTSAAAPIECLRGKQIWLLSKGSGQINGSYEKRCFFSIYLISEK